MTRFRPRPRSLRSGAFCVLLSTLCLAGELKGQEQDSIPADSVVPRPLALPDGIAPADTVADTLVADTVGPPPPTLPPLPLLGPATAARGVWEWNYDALRRLPDLSLLHLLERLPGVVPVRADLTNQVEAASVFGATAGAIRYVVDGFELDPLGSATFDPSRIPLLGLDRVRVERRVTGATVHLETLSPEDPESRTIIEAGAGDYDVQLFRGTFLAPGVLGGPLALGFERLAADGVIGGTSSHTAGWVKWTWVRDSAGVQIEYRQGSMDRLGVREGLNGLRRDWVVRARAGRGPVTGEVYAGASRVEDERGEVVAREGTPHGGLRLYTALDAPVPVQIRTALRLRDHPRLPFGVLELGARAVPLPLVAVEVEALRGWWSEGAGTGGWSARAQAGPLAGVTVFSEAFGGVPLLTEGHTVRVPSPAGAPLQLKREGLRAGAELSFRGVSILAAGLRTSADVVTGFGLAFEPSFPRLAGDAATGFEVIARLPTGLDPVTLHGWYVGMNAPEGWLYMPARHWRAGLTYHHLPLPSGNLELSARLEHVFRGRMAVPAVVAEGADPAEFAVTEVGSYRATNFELGIRVLSVQAFLRWGNIMNRLGQQDLSEFNQAGQHVLYGVKWEFVN